MATLVHRLTVKGGAARISVVPFPSAIVTATRRSSSSNSPLRKGHKTKIDYGSLSDKIMGKDGLPLPPLPATWDETEVGKTSSVVRSSTRKKVVKTKMSSDADDVDVDVPELASDATVDDSIATTTATVIAAEPRPKAKRSKRKPTATATATASATVSNEPEWPPLAKLILAMTKSFPDCILLTRVGNFYESYFHQAPQLASLLGIKLANRRWSGNNVGMAGFPIFQLDKYLKTLVLDHGLLVAIAEEFRTTATVHNEASEISRRVTRVVSPGTLIDEKFVDPFRNNFIASIAPLSEPGQGYGVAWLDIGTADFHQSHCADLTSLRDELARIAPKEIVVDPNTLPTDMIREVVVDPNVFVSYFDSEQNNSPNQLPDELPQSPGPVKTLLDYLRTRLLDHTNELDALTTNPNNSTTVKNTSAFGYPLQPEPLRLAREETMQIDAHTLDALEIKQTSREGSIRGSLFSVLRRTVTRGGTRLLQQWLTAPSTSLETIQTRHDLVQLFLERQHLRNDLRLVMRSSAGDISRVLQKLITRRNDEQDLLEVRDFVAACERIIHKLEQEVEFNKHDPTANILTNLTSKFHRLASLGEALGEAIDERVIQNRLQKQEAIANQLESTVAAVSAGDKSASVATTEGVTTSSAKIASLVEADATTTSSSSSDKKKKKWATEKSLAESPLWGEDFEHLIRPSTSKTLSKMVESLTKLRRQARKLEKSYRESYGGDHLSLRFVLGQGFVVHSKGKPAVDPDQHLHIAGKNRSSYTYYSEAWTVLANRIGRLTKEMKDVESVELELLRQRVLSHLSELRWNARLIDQLDVLVSFSQAAQNYSLTRPTVVADSSILQIEGGRHLSVEIGLLERHRGFTKNSLHMSSDSRVHLVTGPNMGGKSTFLRQTATIVILAQSGCFVPADSCVLGLIDRVFSRVGANDDLFRDRSTFLVEMLETSEILKRATCSSLVIADEIGRGTTTTVGLSIAFASLHHLYHYNKCRTLFATHFHELVDLLISSSNEEKGEEKQFQHLDYFCTDGLLVNSKDGSIIYSHQIRSGVNRQSHGIVVAKMAKMPLLAVQVASKTVEYLEQQQKQNSLALLSSNQSESESINKYPGFHHVVQPFSKE